MKDRPAWSIVREGLLEDRLPGRRLLDASSGNTGIAYAMLGAAGGFGVTLCVPANIGKERLRTLEAYGAELRLTDALEGTDGAVRRAAALAEEMPDRFWYADQYGNPANWRAHHAGTAPEIWRQTRGRLTHLVAGIGTGGTLVGIGRWLRTRAPGARVVGVEPAEALHGIEGLKHLPTALRPGIWDPAVPHRRVTVSTEEAREGAARLAREAGLFVGASAGAAWVAARRVAEGKPEAVAVAVLPDSGARYVSEAWWTG